MKRLDLVGQKFGRLVVVEFAGFTARKSQSMWLCKCDCGEESVVVGHRLKSGHTNSCGCLKTDIENLIGKEFDRLTVIGFTGKDKWGASMWVCKCSCKNEITTRGSSLTSGHAKSCGCLRKDIASEICMERKGKKHPSYIHGLTDTRAYKNDRKQARRQNKKSQTPLLTDIEKKKLLLYYKISEYLGDGWHVDHIRPINKGGAHHPDNLQVLSSELNLKKRDKYPLTPEEEIEYRGIRI